MFRRLLLHLVFVALVAALLFLPSGRLDLPFFWIFLGLWAVAGAWGTIFLDEGLQRERMRPGPGGWDIFPMLFIAAPCAVAQLVVAGLDAGRYHWAQVPVWIQVAGLILFSAGGALVAWAAVSNPFCSSAIRLQADRGHHLISAGSYRFVRHPMYATAIPLLPSISMALGSWWSLLPLAPLLVMIVRRTLLEDRFLMERLDGYPAYAGRVPFRLIPGIW